MAPATVATRRKATRFTAPPAATAPTPTLAPEGIVTAVVGVTGVVDLVADLIVPGAFTRTLSIRRPKVSIGHSWTNFVGRILSIDELKPGDPRLPKRTKDGKPWPAAAGALVATMQFNLNVQAGRDAYEWCRFYAQNNECEFSIGYKVVPTKVMKRRDGVRLIYDLDVFEISLVLFGAAPQTMVLEVKDADGQKVDLDYKTPALVASLDGDAAMALIEAKALPKTEKCAKCAKQATHRALWAEGAAYQAACGDHLDQVKAELDDDEHGGVAAVHEIPKVEGKSAEPMSGRGVMVALYPDAATASNLAVPDGNTPDDLHVTLAYLGHAEDLDTDPAALAETLRGAVADPTWRGQGGIGAGGTLTGHVGGFGQFPAGPDGAPSYIPVDVPGLEHLQRHVVDALYKAGHGPRVASNHGFTPHMTLGYDLPPQAPVPATPVSFDRAHLVVGDDKYALPFLAPAAVEGKDLTGTAHDAVFEATDGAGIDVEGKSGNAGNPASLIHWYDAGAEGAIGWGTDGDFDRCVAIASEHMTETQAKGFCNLRHKAATGIYPATHAKLSREAKSAPGDTAPELETKTMDADVPGSYEQRRDLLRDAIRALMCPPKENSGEGELVESGGWCCVEATYDDYVIATVCKDGGDNQSYAFPYSFDGDEVSLGEPQAVKLSVQVDPDFDGDEPDADGVLADEDTASNVRFIGPASNLIDQVAALVAMAPPATSGKSIREALRESLSNLVTQLEAKAAPATSADDPEADMPEEDDDPWAGLLDDTDTGSDTGATTEPDATDPTEATGDAGDTTPADDTAAADDAAAADTPAPAADATADPDADGDAAGDTDADGDGETDPAKMTATEGKDADVVTVVTLDPDLVRAELAAFGANLEPKDLDAPVAV